MAFKPYELRDVVFAAADRLALAEGLAAVSVEAIHGEIGGGRSRVTSYVREWKSLQSAEAARTPVSLRAMAKRVAEEAWVLAVIELKRAAPSQAKPAERKRATSNSVSKDAPIDTRSFTPASVPQKFAEVPKPSRPAAVRQTPVEVTSRTKRPARRTLRLEWYKAADPPFARAVVKELRGAGHPLYAKEIAIRLPDFFDKLEGYDPTHPSRALDRALAGSSVVRTKKNAYWLRHEAEPPRPRRPSYVGLNTPSARRRRKQQEYVARAVEIIQKARAEIHFSDVWKAVEPPRGYSKGWLRHALRAISLKEGSSLTVDDAVYRWYPSSGRDSRR